jgi:hypothetical protein
MPSSFAAVHAPTVRSGDISRVEARSVPFGACVNKVVSLYSRGVLRMPYQEAAGGAQPLPPVP